MRVLITVVIFTIILHLGCTVDAYPHDVLPLSQIFDNDHRRTKIQLHLDKENENDKDFVDALSGVLKGYQNAKLEKEHVALREGKLQNQIELVNDDTTKLLVENLARLLESPKSNLVDEADTSYEGGPSEPSRDTQDVRGPSQPPRDDPKHPPAVGAKAERGPSQPPRGDPEHSSAVGAQDQHAARCQCQQSQ